jgi:hypothetical protein
VAFFVFLARSTGAALVPSHFRHPRLYGAPSNEVRSTAISIVHEYGLVDYVVPVKGAICRDPRLLRGNRTSAVPRVLQRSGGRVGTAIDNRDTLGRAFLLVLIALAGATETERILAPERTCRFSLARRSYSPAAARVAPRRSPVSVLRRETACLNRHRRDYLVRTVRGRSLTGMSRCIEGRWKTSSRRRIALRCPVIHVG